MTDDDELLLRLIRDVDADGSAYPGQQDGSEVRIDFDQVNERVGRARRAALALLSALEKRACVEAWTQANELRRAVSHARRGVAQLERISIDGASISRRLDLVLVAATAMLEAAPNPSEEALGQAKSSDRTASRARWDVEEREWKERMDSFRGAEHWETLRSARDASDTRPGGPVGRRLEGGTQ